MFASEEAFLAGLARWKLHREDPWATNLAAGPGDPGRVGELEFRNPLEPHPERNIHLEPRQIGAGATMDTGAERDVAVSLPVDRCAFWR